MFMFLKKVFVMFLMGCFLLSTIPVHAVPNIPRVKNNRTLGEDITKAFYKLTDSIEIKSRMKPLVLSYTIDEKLQKVMLSWEGCDNADLRYYVFRRTEKGKAYRLISSKNGLTGTHFIDTLKNHEGASYIISQMSTPPKSKYGINAFSLIKMNRIKEYFSRNDITHSMSNEISINTREYDVPVKPSLLTYQNSVKTHLSWTSPEDTIVKYLIFKECGEDSYQKISHVPYLSEEGAASNDKAIYYIWAINEYGNAGLPLIYSSEQILDNTFIIDNNEESHIDSHNVVLTVPDHATPDNAQISITPVEKTRLKKAPESTFNVLNGVDGKHYEGYDITLDNNSENVFFKEAQLTFTYDETKIPPFLDEDNIFVYYFDEIKKEWEMLETETLDTDNNLITCKVSHFCQFYVGALNLPTEPPQAKGINTTPQNSGYADPMAGIFELSPPKPNNMGSATTSYPMWVPEGINDHTPNVYLSYSSEGQGGNAGYGWNLHFGKIERDTRLGVPQYDGTDSLIFDGEELVVENETSEHISYRFKKEGRFWKVFYKKYPAEQMSTSSTGELSPVVPFTSGPIDEVFANGNIRVYSPDGMQYFYEPGHRKSGNKIFSWHLKEIRDKFENRMVFNYEAHEEGTAIVEYTLSDITYAYKDRTSVYYIENNSWMYRIAFDWADRDDVRSSYRSTFKIRSQKILKGVNVLYHDKNDAEPTVIRRYVLNHAPGAFNKTLLTSICEYNSETNWYLLNKHNFSYDTVIENEFGAVNDGFAQTTFPALNKKGATTDFADINGDGLVDYIYRGGGETKVKINKGNAFTGLINYGSNPTGDSHYYYVDLNGDGRADIVHNKDYQTDTRIKYNYNIGVAFGPTMTYGVHPSEGFFQDMNGDGRADFIHHGTRTYIPSSSPPPPGSDYPGSYTAKVTLSTEKAVVMPPPFPGADHRVIRWEDIFSGTSAWGKLARKISAVNSSKSKTAIPTNYYHNFIDRNGDGLPDCKTGFNTGINFTPADGLEDFTGTKVDIKFAHTSTYTRRVLRGRRYVTETYTRVTYEDGPEIETSGYLDMNGDGAVGQKYKPGESLTTDNHDNIDANGMTMGSLDAYSFTYRSDKKYVCYMDINGDGCEDRLYFDYPTKTLRVKLNQNANKNILTGITNSRTNTGYSLAYGYVYLDTERATTRNYRRRYCLNQVKTTNYIVEYPLVVTKKIAYGTGMYDVYKKDFAGFQKVITNVYDQGIDKTAVSEATYKIDTSPDTKYYIAYPDTFQLSGTFSDFNGVTFTPEDAVYQKYYRTYSDYFNGQLESVTTGYETGVFDTTVGLSATSVVTAKAVNRYTLVNAINGNTMVKYPYIDQVRVWLYDEYGNFMGVNEVEGDVAATTSLIFDEAHDMIIAKNKRSFGDPHHTHDDVIADIRYTLKESTDKWICFPYEYEIRDVHNALLSKKNLLYDGLTTVGEMTDGVMTGVRVFNVDNEAEYLKTDLHFDTYGNIDIITDHNGLTTNYTVTYQPDGNTYKQVVQKTYNDDNLTRTSWFDPYQRLYQSENAYGDMTLYRYDEHSRLQEVQDEIEGVMTSVKQYSYEHDQTGAFPIYKSTAGYLDRRDALTDEDRWITAEFYKDKLGRALPSKYEREIEGTRQWIVGGKVAYDRMGRVIKTGAPSAASYTTTAYVDPGFVQPTALYDYDEFGRLATITNANGLIVNRDYGFEVETAPAGAYYDAPYSRLVRKISLSDNDSRECSSWFDFAGRSVKTDALLDSISNTRRETTFEYTLDGRSRISESSGTVIEQEYDGLGRLKWQQTPDAGKTAYHYDGVTGMIDQVLEYGLDGIDPRVINYSYDEYFRLTKVDYADTVSDVEYQYYPFNAPGYNKGGMQSIIKGDCNSPDDYFSVSYDYKQLSVTETKQVEGMSVPMHFMYDVQGRIKKLQYGDDELSQYYEVVDYAYDMGGFLKRVSGTTMDNGVSTTQNYIEEIKYNEFGQKSYMRYGNGTESTYTYDPMTRLLDMYQVTNAGGTNDVLKYDYTFGIDGNLDSVTNAPNNILQFEQTYQYDEANRLTGASGVYGDIDSYARSYAYDSDNRITNRVLSSTKSYQYAYVGDTHAIDYININGGMTDSIDFDYDDYGNMQYKKTYEGGALSQSTEYKYTANNRLQEVTNNLFKLNFQYDNNGQRLTKKVYNRTNGALIKQSIYINGFLTLSGADTIDRFDKHISDGSFVVASKFNDEEDKTFYYHQNHLGSTAALTDKDGQLYQSYTYLPYGEIWQTEDGPGAVITDDNNDGIDDGVERLFTGHMYDQETGLYYMNSRYYDPDIGVFTRSDPAMSGTNHFAYASCNPVMYVDPLGLSDTPTPTPDTTTSGDDGGEGSGGGKTPSGSQNSTSGYSWGYKTPEKKGEGGESGDGGETTTKSTEKKESSGTNTTQQDNGNESETSPETSSEDEKVEVDKEKETESVVKDPKPVELPTPVPKTKKSSMPRYKQLDNPSDNQKYISPEEITNLLGTYGDPSLEGDYGILSTENWQSDTYDIEITEDNTYAGLLYDMLTEDDWGIYSLITGSYKALSLRIITYREIGTSLSSDAFTMSVWTVKETVNTPGQQVDMYGWVQIQMAHAAVAYAALVYNPVLVHKAHNASLVDAYKLATE